MKISDITRYTYIPKIGFVLKSKIVLLSMLSVLLALVLVTPTSFLTAADANQADAVRLALAHKIPNKKDKMVTYMKDVNVTLTDSIAYQLAEAILVQETLHKIPAELQLSLIRHESRFDQYVVSRSGAVGFYQVMPGVHYDKVTDLYNKKVIYTKDIYDITTNSSVGILVLRDCLHKLHNNIEKALMCYNGASQVGAYSKNIVKDSKLIKEKIFTS